MKKYAVRFMAREDGDLRDFIIEYDCRSKKDATEIAKLTANGRGWRVFSVYLVK